MKNNIETQENIDSIFLKKAYDIIKEYYKDIQDITKIKKLKVNNGFYFFEYNGIIYSCPSKSFEEHYKEVKIAKNLEEDNRYYDLKKDTKNQVLHLI